MTAEEIELVAKAVAAQLQSQTSEVSPKDRRQRDFIDSCRKHVQRHFKKKYSFKL